MVNVYKTSSSEIRSSSSKSTSSNSAIQDIENGETVDVYSNKVRINHSVYKLPILWPLNWVNHVWSSKTYKELDAYKFEREMFTNVTIEEQSFLMRCMSNSVSTIQTQ